MHTHGQVTASYVLGPLPKLYASGLHPELDRLPFNLQASKGIQMQMLTQHPALAYLREHTVQGTAILPAAALLELCLASAHALLPKQQIAVVDATIMSALSLTDAAGVIMCTITPADGVCRVATHATHVSASIIASDTQLDADSGTQAISMPAAHQRAIKALGIWGQHPQAVAASPSAVASIAVHAAEDISSYWLHPAVLDSCLQLGAAVPEPLLESASEAVSFVPVGAKAFHIPHKLALGQQLMSSASLGSSHQASSSSGKSSFRNHAVHSGGRGVHGWLEGLQARATKGVSNINRQADAESLAQANSLYQVAWLTDAPSIQTEAADRLMPRQARTIMPASIMSNSMFRIAKALQTMQQARAQGTKHISLTTLARPSSMFWQNETSSSSITAAGMWGLLRAFAQEHPSVSVSSVSTDTHVQLPLLQTSSIPANAASDAFGLSISQQAVQRPVLLPSVVTPVAQPYQLRSKPRGAINNLVRVPYAPRRLAPGMVEISVQAVGVNFRDVLNVLGMYPGDPGAPGADCAGVVTATGPGVTNLQPGMAVFGLAGGSLGSHVQASAETLVPMPASLKFEQAATTPTVFLTVDTAFNAAAACTPGKKILVHAAAGGVGLAALQQASMLGCSVCATAGSPAKRMMLRSLGIEHVVTSRDTSSATELAHGGGVDVVLNSLTSPGMVAGSVAGVRLGGRFVEISKRDIWSPARLAQERPDLHYSLLAVDFLPPSAIQTGLMKLSTSLAADCLRPLPQAVHGMSNVHSALRQMSQARHVGKIVVSNTDQESSMSDINGSVMITGGLGSLGTTVASWLGEQHMQHIQLTGRTGTCHQTQKHCTHPCDLYTLLSMSALLMMLEIE